MKKIDLVQLVEDVNREEIIVANYG